MVDVDSGIHADIHVPVCVFSSICSLFISTGALAIPEGPENSTSWRLRAQLVQLYLRVTSQIISPQLHRIDGL